MKESSLKMMIGSNQLVQAVGVFDALCAMLVEFKGFPAVYMTGYGTSATLFGYPDLGLITMTEMVENAKRIADAVSIPIISDADTGYGNPINVYRTVREFEKSGVSAIHIEDQEWPKKCGYMSGKRVITTEDMIGKIKSALDSRSSDDFLIIARTDSLAVYGIDDAIERANLYADAGADLVYIDGVQTIEHLKRIPAQVNSKPNMVNLGPLTPNMSAAELKQMGYSVALYPAVCLAAMVTSVSKELDQLKTNKKQRNFTEWNHSFAGLNAFLGGGKFTRLEDKYRS